MSIKSKNFKIGFFVILGNILEYYDFLLFMHVGVIITPLFFPSDSLTETHILSMILTGLSFLIRPIGGLIFGRMADMKGRKYALIESVKWSIFPAICLALLPTHNQIGIYSSILFIVLRMMQGISVGGEYPIAGIYLMEQFKERQGFISSLLVASGTIGSIIGFIISIYCLRYKDNHMIWRYAFIISAIGYFVSYYMRKNLQEIYLVAEAKPIQNNLFKEKLLIILIGMLVGITVFLPMSYSNFFVTKILKLDQGIYTTSIALITYTILVPICGLIYDRISKVKYISFSCLIIIPLSFVALYLLDKSYILLAQIGLVINASFFGAPIHHIMNSLIPKEIKAMNIGLYFMIGISLVGMLPGFFGKIVSETGYYLIPAFVISLVALITYICFKNNKLEEKI